MRKLCAALMPGLLAILLLTTAWAEDTSRSYLFELSIDGKEARRAGPGDTVTVTFTLRRTDTAENSPMYAMQNEIAYDGDFFEPIDGSILVSRGIRTTQAAEWDGTQKLYMNFLSTAGGEDWAADRLVGSFQLRVTGTDGSGTITNTNYLVSTADGRDTYQAAAQDVTVTVTETAAPQPAAHDPSDTEGAGWDGFGLGVGVLFAVALVKRYLKRKIFPRRDP